jgi:sporulation protein YlmC with PRC-barrel domain
MESTMLKTIRSTGLLASTAVIFSATAAMSQTEQPADVQQQPVQVQQQPADQQQPVQAQQQPADQQPATQQQTADLQQSQCIQQLQTVNQRMEQEGYWLGGWNNRYGVADPGPVAGGMAPAPGEPLAPGISTAPDGTATGLGAAGQPVPPGGEVGSPWGNVGWVERPSYEIRALMNAAVVLARRGDEQGCQQLVNTTDEIYGQYSAQLAELGLSADEVTTWRQEQIVASRPVSEIQGAIRTTDLVGSDLRNAEDRDLGEIDNVVVSPQSGQIEYVVVTRGGFLGLGQDRIAVPWNHLRVTPGMSSFVLPVSEDATDNAPTIDDRPTAEGIQQSEQYWAQVIGADATGSTAPQQQPQPQPQQ